ncbi:MAG: mechanosensitive ion channel family protein [Cyanosarcina radialis HA8281-LM2]|jgi:small conductance mechanosensitive channel|nr:mechanosensitive ion channel family protein [Cyanosarcina radialis HA8281-LM2]
MRIRQRIRAKWNFAAVVGAIALILMLVSTPTAFGQTPQIPNLNWPGLNNLLLSIDRNRAVETSTVSLDGYRLLTIATPATGNSNPIEQRVKTIEDRLKQVASSNFDRLAVTTQIDRSSSLPIISVNDRYLMTVTTLDAQIQGSEPQRVADEYAEIFKSALLRAKRERQPEFLMRQGVIALGILIAASVTSKVFAIGQRRYQKQKHRLEAETPENLTDIAEESDRSNVAPELVVQQQLIKQRQSNTSDFKRRLLHLGQAVVWGGSIFAILGLFPYTRWLQPSIVSGPLQILGIAIGTYVLVRLGDLAIARFFEAVQKSEFLTAGITQRQALRLSTLSQVLKSVATIIIVTTGVLISLSVIGVDLVPLLAGAGLIGLAISFAAQSVIKDAINGFLILVEDQYAVGDIISIGEATGLVENINLRITQLRDSEGKLITIPNNTITVVENLSKDWSRVDLRIKIAYNTNPDRALEVLREIAEEMYRDRYWQTQIVELPEVLGIEDIDRSGMLIRVWLKTQPLQQWRVAREFRRRLKLAIEEKGIEIGNPQPFLQFGESGTVDGSAVESI